jgi:hypothetical protein
VCVCVCVSMCECVCACASVYAVMCVLRLQPVPYLLQVEVVTRMAMQVFSNASTRERRAKGSVRSSVAAQRSRDDAGHTAGAPKLGRWGMCGLQMARVGQNRIYTPYMTVYLVISLPKLLYVNRIYIVLANPTDG